jgi:hypothetical protein
MPSSIINTVLLEHAFAHMKDRAVEVVSIGTGGDWFHAPARALYESVGCKPFPSVTYFKELEPFSDGCRQEPSLARRQ